MKDIACKLLVVGAGPGGYVCAVRAGQLGVDTVIVEAGRAGGTCLNVGCIPSKALIHAADTFAAVSAAASNAGPLGISAGPAQIDLARTVAWKDGVVARLTGGVSGLLKRAGVKSVHGRATFRDGKTVAVETETGLQIIRAETIVIATGSVPVELPALPFGGKVISSTEALDLTQVPRRLAVVGGGYIGLEIGTAFAKLGAAVTVIEAQEKILPLYDAELTRPVERSLKRLGVAVHVRAKAGGLCADGQGVLVEKAGGETETVAADTVLVAVGRKPAVEGWGLEALVLERAGSAIAVDDRCRTAMRGIYAIGDVTGEPMLAHRAMAQGEMVAEIVAGNRRSWDKRCIPALCFTDPEIASAGLSPEAARAAGHAVAVASFPLSANGRALTMEAGEGFVRVVARADDHLVLGVQAVGHALSELSAAFALAIEMGARLEDVAGTIHAHPTQGEAFQEAAMKALGMPLHA